MHSTQQFVITIDEGVVNTCWKAVESNADNTFLVVNNNCPYLSAWIFRPG